jgi:transposase-like protein
MSNQDEPDEPRCPKCERSMTLVRTFPKMGGFPELRSYRCTACEEMVTVERRC